MVATSVASCPHFNLSSHSTCQDHQYFNERVDLFGLSSSLKETLQGDSFRAMGSLFTSNSWKDNPYFGPLQERYNLVQKKVWAITNSTEKLCSEAIEKVWGKFQVGLEGEFPLDIRADLSLDHYEMGPFKDTPLVVSNQESPFSNVITPSEFDRLLEIYRAIEKGESSIFIEGYLDFTQQVLKDLAMIMCTKIGREYIYELHNRDKLLFIIPGEDSDSHLYHDNTVKLPSIPTDGYFGNKKEELVKLPHKSYSTLFKGLIYGSAQYRDRCTHLSDTIEQYLVKTKEIRSQSDHEEGGLVRLTLTAEEVDEFSKHVQGLNDLNQEVLDVVNVLRRELRGTPDSWWGEVLQPSVKTSVYDHLGYENPSKLDRDLINLYGSRVRLDSQISIKDSLIQIQVDGQPVTVNPDFALMMATLYSQKDLVKELLIRNKLRISGDTLMRAFEEAINANDAELIEVFLRDPYILRIPMPFLIRIMVQSIEFEAGEAVKLFNSLGYLKYIPINTIEISFLYFCLDGKLESLELLFNSEAWDKISDEKLFEGLILAIDLKQSSVVQFLALNTPLKDDKQVCGKLLALCLKGDFDELETVVSMPSFQKLDSTQIIASYLYSLKSGKTEDTKLLLESVSPELQVLLQATGKKYIESQSSTLFSASKIIPLLTSLGLVYGGYRCWRSGN